MASTRTKSKAVEKPKKQPAFTPRDLSWLSFNGRVLQEANDPTVPLRERIRFLGIHSNNLDEFFRVRVATLKRMIEFGEKRRKLNMHMEEAPQDILNEIQVKVLEQQNEFNRIWEGLKGELKAEKIHLLTETELNREQQKFVRTFFEEQVESNVIPLMIQQVPQLPYLREKSIYLGIVMRKQKSAYNQQYALIEVPARANGRFVMLPGKEGEHNIILLEDVIRYNLPYIFSFFGYDHFSSHVFKVTKDAEIDVDNELAGNLVEKMEKELKKRRIGKAVRFVYDKEMDAGLLEYLIRKLHLSRMDNLIPGGRIHNFRHFMDFPDVFVNKSHRRAALQHPLFINQLRVTEIILKQDVLLHFPYHSFDPVTDLLREAAMDPHVQSIKITAYRLAENSKVVNALINAVRNGKQVTVMLELKARFDEEANLEWKEILEEEGVKVVLGVNKMKVHAKLCVIRKKVGTRFVNYGFVSTGNLNEKTARVYADHCLLTGNSKVMLDINRIFRYLEDPKPNFPHLRSCTTLLTTPLTMRAELLKAMDREIRQKKAGKQAGIIIKLNSLSDKLLMTKLHEAAKAGVQVDLIVRGIYCLRFNEKKRPAEFRAVSIVDEYLEHARVLVFLNGGKPRIYLSSADFMVRNLDHRVEAAVPVLDPALQEELLDILQIQLKDDVKARVLDNELQNEYVQGGRKHHRSQVETYHYLHRKITDH